MNPRDLDLDLKPAKVTKAWPKATVATSGGYIKECLLTMSRFYYLLLTMLLLLITTHYSVLTTLHVTTL